MFSPRKARKRGFTLIETVVTVGIMASLAAVVIPQVVSQFDDADPTRLQNDLKSLQTSIELFNVNTKVFPADLDDLANAITATGDEDSTLSTGTTLAVYNATSQTPFWNGPYADFSLADLANTDLTRSTGFGAAILDSFVCYASGNNEHGTSEGVAAAAPNDQACPGTGLGQKFLAIQITGLATAVTDQNFIDINMLFDGNAESAPGTQGRVRFGTVGANNVVYFLAVPLS